MRQKKNKCIDLTKKSPMEIYEYLQAVLAMRQLMNKNGINVRIKKTKLRNKTA